MGDKIYFRLNTNGKKEIYDIVRKKYVAFTPEEQVRQQLIHLLHYALGVPLGCIGVESSCKIYKQDFRIDIRVNDKNGKTLWIIECKRPEVKMDATVVEQILRYNIVIDARFCMISNGKESFCWEKVIDHNLEKKWELCTKLPLWSEL